MTTIQAKLEEPSLDHYIGNLASALIEILLQSRVEFFLFGSAALLARLPEAHRLPGDIDIGIAKGGLVTLQAACSAAGYETINRPGFAEIVTPKSRCHLVEGQFDLISPTDQMMVGSYSFEQTIRYTESVALKLKFFQPELRFPAPTLEETLFLCLLKPLNTTTVRDFQYLLNNVLIDQARFASICNRSREAAVIVKHRLNQLKCYCEGPGEEQMNALVATMAHKL